MEMKNYCILFKKIFVTKQIAHFKCTYIFYFQLRSLRENVHILFNYNMNK